MVAYSLCTFCYLSQVENENAAARERVRATAPLPLGHGYLH